ncbi:MAG: hypothetical protein VKI83_08455 [Synechococcaceae cyanobacterium]|nr:hypothetical protein [Synechococcaceae cyanobacterium]
MEELLANTLESAAGSAAADSGLGPATSANGLVFLAITMLGLAMAVVYVPVRLLLTLTARSRRLRLLQKIRKLRDDMSQPLDPARAGGS